MEEFSDTQLLTFLSYLDTMPNVFSKTLFLSYAFDCYYLLENYKQNYVYNVAAPSSIQNTEPSSIDDDGKVNMKRRLDFEDLIFIFLVYVNKELLPVLTELWQAACDYLDCRLSNDSETYDEFTKILITYASSCKHDLTLDFAALSTQTLNELAAEFNNSLQDNIHNYAESWVVFEDTMIPKIREILMKSDHASDKSKNLSKIKESISSDYSDIKDTFSKDDLKKIEKLIKKTQKLNSYKWEKNKSENSFSDILTLQNNFCHKDDFYDAADTFARTSAKVYRAESHYCLSHYYFKTEENGFNSKF